MCCRPWGRKEVDTTERLNGTEMNGIGEGKREGYIFNYD